jgi:hypothetical protein
MDGRNPQYGFAHRVNDWDVIVDVLDAHSGSGTSPGNGIECDIGWSTYYNDWIVAHDSFWFPSWASEYLYEWLGELQKQLATGKYDESFAALWLDIKTPNAADTAGAKYSYRASLQFVLDQVRKYVPSSVAVLYDLQDKSSLGIGGGSTTAYDLVKSQLRPNEGIAVLAGDVKSVGELYSKLKQDKVPRAVVHHGHSTNIDEDILIEINKPIYHNTADPYRLKKVLTWTNTHQSTMEDYINPAHAYHTDGQIVGRFAFEWAAGYGDLDDFDKAVATFSSTQRKAVRSDDFWGRSGSDVTSPAFPTQPGWRWCRKCQGMFFAGNPTTGACPAGGGHDPSQSGAYRLPHNNPPRTGWQDGWRWCRRCQGLFRPTPSSRCPVPGIGAHDGSQSGAYSLAMNIHPPTQDHWLQCEKCAGLYFSLHSGVCPVDHKDHDAGFAFIANYAVDLS